MNMLASAAVILLLSSAAPAAEIADCRVVAGWEQEGPVRVFTPENLFEYVDGEANAYLIYEFIRLQNVTCKSGTHSIAIDVSEMADADAAYGLFSSRQDATQPTARIGMGGQIQPQRAIFCKGQYYVELASSSDTPALQAFVAELEKRVSGRSEPPRELAWFTPERPVSVKMVPESVLGLSLLKRGYVAQYEFGKAFVVEEESAEAATGVMNELHKRMGKTTPTNVADEAFLATDRYLGELCFFRKGRYLGGFANLSQPDEAARLALSLAERIP